MSSRFVVVMMVPAVLAANGSFGRQPSGAVVTTGIARTSANCGVITACTSGARVNFNAANCGTVAAADGSQWTVPAQVHQGAAAVDIYNDCTGPGDNPGYLSQLETVVIDQDGVEIARERNRP